MKQTRTEQLDALAALKAALLAGAMLLVVPQGSPWAGISFFSGTVMGRRFGADGSWPPFLLVLLHFVLAVGYTFVIASVVRHLRAWRAILVGGAIGAGLYVLNLIITSVAFPGVIGGEIRPAFTHLVFGLFAAAAYRGLAHRRLLKRSKRTDLPV